MKIDRKTVLKTAELASVEISDKEIDRYHKEFNDMLEYVEQLQRIDVKEVKPTSHVSETQTPLRDDNIGECLDRDSAMQNHKGKKGRFFTVPKFIEQ